MVDPVLGARLRQPRPVAIAIVCRMQLETRRESKAELDEEGVQLLTADALLI